MKNIGFYWAKSWFGLLFFGIISAMKKSNNNTQIDIKTMEQMVADLQLKLVDSEKKHQETIKSKDNVISALHHQLFVSPFQQ